MCDGLFLKVDNKLTCSCLIGYYAELGDAARINVSEFLKGPIIDYIKSSFATGFEPFPICGGCYCRVKTPTNNRFSVDQGILLHVEPANSCRLHCSSCLCTVEQGSDHAPPRRLLDFDIYTKTITELAADGVYIRALTFAGFGEPVYHPRLTNMAHLARSHNPKTFVSVDTNGNFSRERALPLADCGFSQIRVGLDGVDQQSYAAYRKGGDFAKVLAFTAVLSERVAQTASGTSVVWKYILFQHNDRDDQLAKAMQLANSVGVQIEFDWTVGRLASRRSEEELREVIGKGKIGSNIDRESVV